MTHRGLSVIISNSSYWKTLRIFPPNKIHFKLLKTLTGPTASNTTISIDHRLH